MKQHFTDERTGIRYTLQGDYYLPDLQEKIADVQVRYDDKKTASMTFMEIDNSGKKSLTGKYTVSAEDYQKLTSLAKRSYSA
ncbi:MAG: hypothetical protein KIG33_08745, partial [Oscillospiraceae bacterium]|nr:hypothetical protein [Oscillospiraceae bacterium]